MIDDDNKKSDGINVTEEKQVDETEMRSETVIVRHSSPSLLRLETRRGPRFVLQVPILMAPVNHGRHGLAEVAYLNNVEYLQLIESTWIENEGRVNEITYEWVFCSFAIPN